MSQLMKRITKKGFTLIELMIVVAIIGILAAIAIPKFADLITKSKESATKGALGSLRSSLTIYYSNTEGYFPANPTDLQTALTSNGTYIDRIPSVTIPKHSVGAGNTGHSASAAITATTGDGSGYVYTASSGTVFIKCTEIDTKSVPWNTY